MQQPEISIHPLIGRLRYFSDTKGPDAQDPDPGVVASPESQAGMCFYVYTPSGSLPVCRRRSETF